MRFPFFAETAETYSKRAWALVELKRWDGAIREALQGLAREAQHLGCLHVLCWAQTQQGKLGEAEATARSIIKAYPQRGIGYYLISFIVHRLYRPEEALDAIRVALQINPNVVDYHIQASYVLLTLNRYLESAEASRKALALNPKTPMALNNLGVALGNLGEYRQAEAEYRKAVELDPQEPLFRSNLIRTISYRLEQADPHTAEQEARLLVQQYPNSKYAHAALGSVLKKLRRRSDALECMHEAIRLDPRDAKQFAEIGCHYCSLRQHQAGIESCQKALALDSNHLLALYNLACNLRRLGRYTEAEEYHRKAVMIDPKARAPRSQLANFLARYGDENGKVEAESIARQLIVESPSRAANHQLLAYVLGRQERFHEALQAMQDAMRLETNDYSLVSLAYYLLETERFEEAVAASRQAIRKAPDSARGYNNLSNGLERLGHVAEADLMFQKALAIDADDDAIYADRAKHKMRQGKFQEALTLLQRAIELEPYDIVYQKDLQTVYQHLQSN
ncbi:MAG: tetratricopeptide repeat protein [Caldilineaceae bacterium]